MNGIELLPADGRPTGALRVSFGYMTCRSDVDALISLVSDFFVEAALPAADVSSRHSGVSTTGCQAQHQSSPTSDATAASSSHERSPPQRQKSLTASPAACSESDSAAPSDSFVSDPEPADLQLQQCQDARTLSKAASQKAEVPTCLADGLYASHHPAESASSSETAADGNDSEGDGLKVVGMWVFPVKSAASMLVDMWPLGPNGLLYDRYATRSSPL